MRISDHDLDWNTDDPTERAMFRLAEAHFAAFNALCADRGKRNCNRWRRGMQLLEHAFGHLNNQRPQPSNMAAAINHMIAVRKSEVTHA